MPTSCSSSTSPVSGSWSAATNGTSTPSTVWPFMVFATWAWNTSSIEMPLSVTAPVSTGSSSSSWSGSGPSDARLQASLNVSTSISRGGSLPVDLSSE